MIANVRHILPVTRIRRQRLLPRGGRVLVRKGQKVNAVDAIAEAILEPEHFMLDFARALGLHPDRADQHLQRKPGDVLAEDDILAGPVGFARRVLRVPRSARVVLSGRGKILLEAENPPFQLQAGLPGVVISLIPERGVVIETTGALVQGIWGNGRIASGALRKGIDRLEDVLTSDRLEGGLRGAVLLAGYCSDAEVLKLAQDLPLGGLILSSMAASLVPDALQMTFPIVLLEGFGLQPMNLDAYQILTNNVGQDVAINAELADPYANRRPEVVIGLPVGEPRELPPEVLDFSPGQRVSVVRAPYHGQVGTIVALNSRTETLPSGIKVPVARVRMENGEIASLPLVNLEVLV